MRWSKSFIPTLRETPKVAKSISHALSIKAGLVRPLVSGIYSYLPLGWRVISKIIDTIREEMNCIEAQELFLPALTPRSLWQETGRWEEYGQEMFKLKDRKNRDMCLAPTHEEIITKIASDEIISYKHLPQIWYQIQIKFRDELRPRSGLERLRQFIMKDSYSFDADENGFKKSYKLHRDAYINIFKRCGLDFVIVAASSGLMGGSLSEEFMVISENGEDKIVICEKCGYKANLQIADSENKLPNFKDEPLSEIHTPVEGTVEEVSKFLKMPKSKFMKSLLYIMEEKPIFLLLDGEHELSDEKIQKIGNTRVATPDEIKEITGVEPGYVGPIGLNVEVIADKVLKGKKGLITGANKTFYHLKGVNLERDVKVKKYLDIRLVKEGDRCIKCKEPLFFKNAIEIAHIFNLGTKYSEAMDAFFIDKKGKRKPIIMGSYGIGPERIMTSIIETYHDKNGIIWPLEVAPYKVLILSLNISVREVQETAELIYKNLKLKTEVLIDDRLESAGVKFKDADLIGIPLQIIVGERELKKGNAEIKFRGKEQRKKIKKEKVVEEIIKILNH